MDFGTGSVTGFSDKPKGPTSYFKGLDAISQYAFAGYSLAVGKFFEQSDQRNTITIAVGAPRDKYDGQTNALYAGRVSC